MLESVSWMCRPMVVAVLAACVSLVTPRAWSIVVYVDQSITVPGDGFTWQTAKRDLQSALSLTAGLSGSHEIRIGPGTYKPTARIDTNDPRSATFSLKNGLTLRGGYAGTAAADPNLWEPEQFLTTLSGDIAGDDSSAGGPGSDNVYHVLMLNGISASATLAGLNVSGGNADVENVETRTHLGGGLLVVGGSINIADCQFTQNFARYGGGCYTRDGTPSVQRCRFAQNHAVSIGGAIRMYSGQLLTVSNSVFESNSSDSAAAAIGTQSGQVAISHSRFQSNVAAGTGGAYAMPINGGSATFNNCEFNENNAISGGAINCGGALTVDKCTFDRNSAHYTGGAMILVGSSAGYTIRNSVFSRNRAEQHYGGAIAFGTNYGGTGRVHNCVFIGNVAPTGGAILGDGVVEIQSTTITGNSNHGIRITSPSTLTLGNCIVWGNALAQIVIDDNPPEKVPPTVVISNSNIEGSWPGQGNINADPRFVQPGCGNPRLGPTSPCIDAGSNALVPPLITTDLDGQPRIANGTIDMGAYEGAHPALPLIACEDDIDVDEVVDLVPAGRAFNGLERAGARIVSYKSNDAAATLELINSPIHIGVGGYSELAAALRYETTLPDGGHRSKIVIPFNATDLGLLDYDDVEITVFSTTLGRWSLAVASNIQDSPEHSGPVGDRIVVVGEGNAYGMTADIGDYGVFWNPVLQRGFAWANVDHQGDLAVGAPLPPCPSDCANPSDGIVGPPDLLEVISHWGIAIAGEGADTNADFAVNVTDLLSVIGDWGPCR